MKEPFFSLLRTGLGWGENNLKIFPISVAEWREIWMQAQKQTVCGFVFAGIEKLPAEMQPPKEILMRMWTYTERIKKTNLKIGVVANEILGWYEAEGLEPTIIKGITSGALYNRPELRTPGDIDLFFQENYDKAVPVARSKGADVTLDDNHDVFDYKGIHVELHHRAFKTLYPVKDLDLSPIRFESESYRGGMLNVKANAMLMMIHPARHFMNEGIGLRQLCDWAMFLKKYEGCPELEEAWKEVKRQGAERFVVEFTAIAVHYLGLQLKDEEKWIGKSRESLREKMLEIIMERGNFAHSVRAKNRQYVYYIKLFHYFVLVYPFWKKFIWMSIPKRIGNRILLILKLK